ncbi:regulatory-associated protein of mTOR isoform X1 [Glossina fuscipes]|uniref:Regulatory-associated protein of mTOR isoform X1 n=1 Tax=Glossina fuscipes TaxID=7396 RepID=A0A8U0W8Z3_9MUSC|nr:regulatory-associated protein of mTOR isoform X1 [Glossina fuscipes]
MFESHYMNAKVADSSSSCESCPEAVTQFSPSPSTGCDNEKKIILPITEGPTGSVSRKTSMSESQQLHPLLQKLSQEHFSELVPDHQCPLCFQAKRHQETIEGLKYERQPWRIRERMKTASVALVLCLNIGVDPPDVIKIQPCARLECWIDPSSVSAPKAMDMIGANLQMQYERWQPRARYKKCHDPTVEDVKKLCTSLRRNAKGERILFHYNGHGVPKPTANGEIWVFNKTFTQYIPLSIFELQNWMAAPSIYVYDCSNAGIIIQSFLQFAEQHEREMEKAVAASSQRIPLGGQPAQLPPIISYKNCIHLAACSVNEILPMNAQLPADLFTSCLTTPINIALKWYTMRENFGLVPRLHSEFIDKIPGKVNDRRTMMGELNWVFTAITDTIAWNTLPRELFQKLFRQDLLVASLFRNFLLAERILRSHDCTPVSHPALPPCFRHPMWTAWDLVVDLALRQLPDILERGAPYRQLPFFEEQLTAFQVWLDRESESRTPPEQLPIVLQVLLSQVHRLRALELLARFLDLGPWAVNLALGVGIFPYVLKLLQSSAKELRPVLVFIWAKILAVDPSCQVDLVKDNKYFLSVLQDPGVPKEYRTLSAFVLACIVNNFLLGQTSALQGSLVSICLEQLNDDSWLLRQWLAICLGMLWQNFEKARWSGVRDLAHEKLYSLLKDQIPEVRAAAVFALGTFISSVRDRSEEHANNIDRIIAITLLENVGEDMSPLVRLELIAALQWMVLLFESQFVTVYMQENMVSSSALNERGTNVSHIIPGVPFSTVMPGIHHHSTHSLERNFSMRRGASSSSISNISSASIPFYSIFLKLWQGIYQLGYDPFPKVAETAQKIIAYIRDAALCLITAKEATTNDKCLSLSVSLPPSPNTKISYLSGSNGESPPVVKGDVLDAVQSSASHWASKFRTVSNEPQAMLQRKLRTTSMNDETDSAAPPPTSTTNESFGNGGGDGSASGHSSTSDTNYDVKSQNLRPIVITDFIPWAISYFTRPGKYRYSTDKETERVQVFRIDKNSPELRARECRLQRNRIVRRKAKDQQARTTRIDHQCWMRKTQYTPSIVKLLPYENQIAVAYKEKVLVYDWQRNTVKTFTPTPAPALKMSRVRTTSSSTSSPPSAYNLSQNPTTARVSAIEFLNPQDVALTLVGHEDGVIRIWQANPNEAIDEQMRESAGRLVTAWVAMPSLHASYNGTSSGTGFGTSSKHSRKDTGAVDGIGLITAWQQCCQQLITAGGSTRCIRIWDIEREYRLCDIPMGNESCVRILSPFPNNVRGDIIAAGCSDGSVRLYDKRCSPQDSRIRVYREHSGAILSACLKDDQTSLITGCSQGKISVIDLRLRAPKGVVQQWDAGNDITAVSIHQAADLIACGSANKIAVYNSQQGGRAQSMVRSHESFMGTKISHPTCLAFHSHKASLAVGFVDNTVAVYEPSSGILTNML